MSDQLDLLKTPRTVTFALAPGWYGESFPKDGGYSWAIGDDSRIRWRGRVPFKTRATAERACDRVFSFLQRRGKIRLPKVEGA